MKFKDTKYGDLTGQHYMGSILVNGLGLTSLEGAPREVSGSFNCSDNNLTSLEYGPDYVSGYYNATGNKNLTSLKGCATTIKGAFWCDKSSIKQSDVLNEIITNAIRAERYMVDKVIFNWNSSLKDDIDRHKNLKTQVKSKGFRSMLGLDK
mgnify:CR=1 FL=1